MPLSKLVTASLLGALSFSSGVLAKRDLRDFPKGGVDAPAPIDGSVSVASCTVVAITNAEAIEEARAYAVAKTASYACGGDGAATAEAVTQATASALALAAAQASGECYFPGNASGYFTAKARSLLVAEEWLAAYGVAVPSAASCTACESYAESWDYVSRSIILDAIDSVPVSEHLESSDPRTKVIAALEYRQNLEAAIAAAYAEPVANVQSVYDRYECYAFEFPDCIYTEEHPEGICAECTAESVNLAQITEIPAIATAAAEAVAFTCGGKSVVTSDAYPTASALAEATAEALSLIYMSCAADDGSYACAEASGFIETSAGDVAEAFAEAWASGLTCGDYCYVNVEVAAASVGEVLVTAASEAYATACAEGGESWTVEQLALHIESAYLEAIAEATLLSFTHQEPNICIAAVLVAAPTPSSV